MLIELLRDCHRNTEMVINYFYRTLSESDPNMLDKSTCSAHILLNLVKRCVEKLPTWLKINLRWQQKESKVNGHFTSRKK